MKTKILKTLIISALLATTFLTGCEKADDASSSEASLEIKAYTKEEEQTEKPVESSKVETSEIENIEEVYKKLRPKVKYNNISNYTKLGTFTFDEKEIDIADLTVEDFVSITGLEYQLYATANTYSKGFDYYAKGFGDEGNEGSTFFVEAVQDKEIVTNFEKAQYSNYEVKAISVSESFLEEEDLGRVEFYGKLRIGSTKEEVEAVLGEGFYEEDTFKLYAVYKNNIATMVIVYENGVADEIYLIRNL